MYEELLKLNNKKTTTCFKNEPETVAHVTGEHTQMVETKRMKRCFRKTQTKATVRYQYTPVFHHLL